MTMPPMPPTDNLYKFMALGGVALIIWTQTLFWWVDSELSAKLSELETAIAALEIEAKMLDRESKKLAEVDRLEATKRAPPSRPAEVRKQLERLQELESRHAVKDAEARSKFNHVKELRWKLQLTGNLSRAGLAIGLVMVVLGFRLWYTRVQVYQDRALRREEEHDRRPPNVP